MEDSVGGYVLEFPSFRGDIKDFILWNAKYYGRNIHSSDFVNPKLLGHQVIAEKIHSLVFETISRHQLESNTLGIWSGGKDRCTSLYSYATITDDIHHFTNMNLVNFNSGLPWKSGSKWALEVDQNGGSFILLCHFLIVMSTSPTWPKARTENIYLRCWFPWASNRKYLPPLPAFFLLNDAIVMHIAFAVCEANNIFIFPHLAKLLL
jgi:hypothetical protein